MADDLLAGVPTERIEAELKRRREAADAAGRWFDEHIAPRMAEQVTPEAIRAARLVFAEVMIERSPEDLRKLLDLRDTPGFINEAEAADRIGISLNTMKRHRYNGTGPDYTTVGRWIRYQPAAIDAWVAANTKPSVRKQ